MFDFHEKRKIRRVIYSKVFIAAVFIATIFLGMSVYERYSMEREMAAKLDDRARELRVLEERALLLESKVEHLKNERGIEEELRTRFDVAREGEQVVIIIDDAEQKKAENHTENTEENESEADPSLLEMLKFW
jgi:hypothetical protein